MAKHHYFLALTTAAALCIWAEGVANAAPNAAPPVKDPASEDAAGPAPQSQVQQNGVITPQAVDPEIHTQVPPVDPKMARRVPDVDPKIAEPLDKRSLPLTDEEKHELSKAQDGDPNTKPNDGKSGSSLPKKGGSKGEPQS